MPLVPEAIISPLAQTTAPSVLANGFRSSLKARFARSLRHGATPLMDTPAALLSPPLLGGCLDQNFW